MSENPFVSPGTRSVASELKATYRPSALTLEAKGEAAHQALLPFPSCPVLLVEQAAMSPGAAIAGTPIRETIDTASTSDKRVAVVTLDFRGREEFLKKVTDIRPTPRIDRRYNIGLHIIM
jgi:hypothetical protein